MVLGFKKQFNNPIIKGTKIHTIRKGHRWRPGMSIQFYNNVRTKYMRKFKNDGICVFVQDISILTKNADVIIDGKYLKIDELITLSQNDGFSTIIALFDWFKNGTNGQIIHWTDFKY